MESSAAVDPSLKVARISLLSTLDVAVCGRKIENRLGRKAADVARTLIEEVDVEKTENEEKPKKKK